MSERCPECGELVTVPADLPEGGIFECPNCAGTYLRQKRIDGRQTLEVVPMVSCPGCEELLPVPEGAKPGDPFTCCGRTYRLTYAYGAWALEE